MKRWTTWGDHEKNSRLLKKLGAFLGAEDYLVPVNAPTYLKSDTCLGRSERLNARQTATILSTPKVVLTNRRADLCHRYSKLYLHHSCGLIRDLLPVYRTTRMDGVDAFTPPPIGNVTWSEGRAFLGSRYSMIGGLGGLTAYDEATVRRHVAAGLDDARKAGNVILSLGGGPSRPFPALERIFMLAQQLKRNLP